MFYRYFAAISGVLILLTGGLVSDATAKPADVQPTAVTTQTIKLTYGKYAGGDKSLTGKPAYTYTGDDWSYSQMLNTGDPKKDKNIKYTNTDTAKSALTRACKTAGYKNIKISDAAKNFVFSASEPEFKKARFAVAVEYTGTDKDLCEGNPDVRYSGIAAG